MQAAGDFGFADAGTLELSHLVSVEGCGEWPAQALAVLACVRQSGAYPFPENLPFELGVLQLFAKRGLCGGRDYAKPQHRRGGAACMSAMWDSALSRSEQRSNQRIGCLESASTQAKRQYGLYDLQLLRWI